MLGHSLIPTSNKLTLVSRDFHLAACLRMGLAMPFNECISQCNCVLVWMALGTIYCHANGVGPVWTHESIANVRSNTSQTRTSPSIHDI